MDRYKIINAQPGTNDLYEVIDTQYPAALGGPEKMIAAFHDGADALNWIQFKAQLNKKFEIAKAEALKLFDRTPAVQDDKGFDGDCG